MLHTDDGMLPYVHSKRPDPPAHCSQLLWKAIGSAKKCKVFLGISPKCSMQQHACKKYQEWMTFAKRVPVKPGLVIEVRHFDYVQLEVPQQHPDAAGSVS